MGAALIVGIIMFGCESSGLDGDGEKEHLHLVANFVVNFEGADGLAVRFPEGLENNLKIVSYSGLGENYGGLPKVSASSSNASFGGDFYLGQEYFTTPIEATVKVSSTFLFGSDEPKTFKMKYTWPEGYSMIQIKEAWLDDMRLNERAGASGVFDIPWSLGE